jgi:hypothetical protein
MAKRYIVDLTKDEKEQLIELTRKGRPGARKIKRAHNRITGSRGMATQMGWRGNLESWTEMTWMS